MSVHKHMFSCIIHTFTHNHTSTSAHDFFLKYQKSSLFYGCKILLYFYKMGNARVGTRGKSPPSFSLSFSLSFLTTVLFQNKILKSKCHHRLSLQMYDKDKKFREDSVDVCPLSG